MLVFSQLTTFSTEAFVANFVFFSDSQFFLQNVSFFRELASTCLGAITLVRKTSCLVSFWKQEKLDKTESCSYVAPTAAWLQCST